MQTQDKKAKVIISSRKLDACVSVAKEINDLIGAEVAFPISANISKKEELENLVAETQMLLGKVDVLVCNAASNPYYGSMSGISDEQFTKILQNNIVANNWLVNFVLPDMKKRKDGAIIMISSVGGLRGTPVLGAYAISKAADMQMVRNLAVEHGPSNIRVNAIAPGLVKTDFGRAIWDNPEGKKLAESAIALRRLGETDDIAGLAVFLASRAGEWTTGQTFVIDGGYSA